MDFQNDWFWHFDKKKLNRASGRTCVAVDMFARSERFVRWKWKLREGSFGGFDLIYFYRLFTCKAILPHENSLTVSNFRANMVQDVLLCRHICKWVFATQRISMGSKHATNVKIVILIMLVMIVMEIVNVMIMTMIMSAMDHIPSILV